MSGYLKAALQLEQGLEDEPPFGQARVRNDELGLVDSLVAVEEEVEIDRPRAEARAGAITPELEFDCVEPGEERPRGKGRAKRRRAVQEARLVEVPDRIGLTQGRDGDDVDVAARGEPIERAADRLLAFAQVGSKSDVDNGHA